MAPQLPSWCRSKGTVESGKAKIHPRIIIHLETLEKKRMQAVLGVSPAGLKTCRVLSVPVLGKLCCTVPLCCTYVRKLLLLNPSFSSELIPAGKIHFLLYRSSTAGTPCCITQWHWVLGAVPCAWGKLQHSSHFTAQQKPSGVLFSVDTSDFPHECGGWRATANSASVSEIPWICP